MDTRTLGGHIQPCLAKAGHDARIDRRTLEAQGIDRVPTIHEGPRGQYIDDNVVRPSSKSVFNGAGRFIDYPAIDRGLTRREFNAKIIDFNLVKAARSDNFEVSAWALFEKDQLEKDRVLEAKLSKQRHELTAERRTISAQYTARKKRIRAEKRLKSRQVSTAVKERFQVTREALQARQSTERQALRKEQKKFLVRVARRLSRKYREKHRRVAVAR